MRRRAKALADAVESQVSKAIVPIAEAGFDADALSRYASLIGSRATRLATTA